MKTHEEIDEINRKRAECMKLLVQAQEIMRETGCSLGADTIGDAIAEIYGTGMDTY